MNQVSTDVKTHAIQTIKGSVYFINERQRQAVVAADMSDRLDLGEVVVSAHQIAEITDIETYYDNNPDKRPVYDTPAPFTAEHQPLSRKKADKAMSLVAKGFENYWKGREMPAYAKKMANRFANRLINSST